MPFIQRSYLVRPWRFAIVASLTLHAVFFFAVLGSCWVLLNPISPNKSTYVVIRASVSKDISIEDYATLPGSIQSSDDSAALKDPRWQPSIERFESDNNNVAGDDSFVANQIHQSIQKQKNRPVTQNQNDLQVLGERLSAQSSEKSVDEISRFLRGISGPSRETRPDPNAVGKPIDYATAQMDDVRQVADKEGNVRYIAILVDAKGVSVEVELDHDAGEQLDRTMKLIKSNPLLERVYRQIVMGLMDQLLKPTNHEPGR